MSKQLLMSIAAVAFVGALVVGATIAYFSDTETSSGNIFTAGSVDLKVDHTYASYNGNVCGSGCTEGQTEMIQNGGFEEPGLSSGTWQVFTDATQTQWTVVGGAGLEIQNNAAGAPHSGNQLAELDSHGTGSQSTIKQVITTVPGQQYRLTFYHSPRPGNGPDTDNAVRLNVLVTSTSGTMVDQVIAQNSYQASNTVWTKYTYDFVALNTQTTIQFSDAGTQPDTLGGYLDDVSLRTLDCPQHTYPYGGTCNLWSEKDLQGDAFWNFTDVKPGDYGTSVISLHVYGNDAYSCLFPTDIVDNENTVIKPELPMDTTSDVGELSGELEFFVWGDANANNVYDSGETVYVTAGTPFKNIQQSMLAMPLLANNPISLIGFNWCAGTQTLTGTTVSCAGNGMGNIAQTDSVISSFVAYAEQQRNNAGFSCASVQLPPAQQ